MEQIREPTATELVLLQRAEAAEANAERLRAALKRVQGGLDAMANEGLVAEGTYEYVNQALSNEPDKTAEARQAVVEAAMALRGNGATEVWLAFKKACDNLAKIQGGNDV